MKPDTPVDRLSQAWDRFLTAAAAESFAVDSSVIVPVLGRRLTRTPCAGRYVVLMVVAS